MKRRRGRGEEKKKERGKGGRKKGGGGGGNLIFYKGSIYFLRTKYYSENFDACGGRFVCSSYSLIFVTLIPILGNWQNIEKKRETPAGPPSDFFSASYSSKLFQNGLP